MSKYSPLTRHLATRQKDNVAMAFQEVETVLGFPLPPSARKYRAWWSNNPSNSVMTQAWLDAGYISKEVDLAAERLVFQKLNAVEAQDTTSPALPRTPRRHPLFGICKGQIWVDPAVDLTEPVYEFGEDWLEDSATLIRSGMAAETKK